MESGLLTEDDLDAVAGGKSKKKTAEYVEIGLTTTRIVIKSVVIGASLASI